MRDDRWQQKDNKMQIGKFINLYGSIWLRLIHIFLSSFVFQNVHHRFKASQRQDHVQIMGYQQPFIVLV